MIVPFEEYPQNRPWDEKVFSMPNIPRGTEGLLVVLYDILQKVKEHCNTKDLLVYKGSNSKITLNEACVRLRPMRLVVKTAYGWELSKDSERWLETNLYQGVSLVAPEHNVLLSSVLLGLASPLLFLLCS